MMSDAVLGSWGGSVATPTEATLARTRFGGRLGLAVLSLCAALIVAVMAVPRATEPVPRDAVSTVAPVPAWLDIVKPVQVFSLQAASLAGLPLVYSARRRSADDGREDVLAFGTLAGEKPALRLRIFRTDTPTRPVPPLYVAMARQAAEAGLSLGRTGLPDLMGTRFGAFEIADLVLTGHASTGPRGGSAQATCDGFRLVLDHPGLTITGLACGGASAWPRRALACVINRLDLASGGEDRPLIDFFAATELKQDGGCGGMRLAPDTVHAPWLDDKPATPRRTLRRH